MNSLAGRSTRDATLLNVLVWILQIALAGYLVYQSVLPLYEGGSYERETFDRIGLGQWFRHFTATVELLGSIGLLIPPLCGLAALGLAGVMIGAIITEFSVRTPAGAVLPAILLALYLIVAWYRWPTTKALIEKVFRRRGR